MLSHAAWSLFISTQLWWHALTAAFTLVDAFFDSPRVQPNAKNVVKSNRFCRALLLSLFNTIMVSFGVLVFVDRYFEMFSAEARGVVGTMSDLIVCVVAEEVCFYYLHRLFHTKMLYRLHKIHHEFTSPSALTTAYAHPIEHVVCNLLPLFAGPLLVRPPLTTWMMWWMAAIASTMISHSGYTWLNSGHHDAHHRLQNVNFGLGMLDRLHGTMEGMSIVDPNARGCGQCLRNLCYTRYPTRSAPVCLAW
jgi:methylsterol monooxygenase